MGKYSKFEGRNIRESTRPYTIHPVWRGIGCIMLVLIPLLSYAGAVLLVQANRTQHWLPVPRDLAATIAIPFVGRIPYLYANLLTAGVLSLLGFGALMVIYSLLYRVVGPPSLGPQDAPPIRRKVKKSR